MAMRTKRKARASYKPLPKDFRLHWRAEIDALQFVVDARGLTAYAYERKGVGFVSSLQRPKGIEALIIGPRVYPHAGHYDRPQVAILVGVSHV